MKKGEIDDKIKKFELTATLKLGRYRDNIYLATKKGNILVKSLTDEDINYLLERYSVNTKNTEKLNDKGDSGTED